MNDPGIDNWSFFPPDAFAAALQQVERALSDLRDGRGVEGRLVMIADQKGTAEVQSGMQEDRIVPTIAASWCCLVQTVKDGCQISFKLRRNTNCSEEDDPSVVLLKVILGQLQLRPPRCAGAASLTPTRRPCGQFDISFLVPPAMVEANSPQEVTQMLRTFAQALDSAFSTLKHQADKCCSSAAAEKVDGFVRELSSFADERAKRRERSSQSRVKTRRVHTSGQ